MVLSPLNKSSLVLGTENRSKLFYNKFRYRAKVFCAGLHYTCYVKNVDQMQSQITRIFTNYIGFNSSKPLPNINKLSEFVEWKLLNQDKIIVRVEMETAAVFSNDLSLLKTLGSIFDLTELTEVLVTEDPNVVTLNNPKHSFRIYLKNKIAPDEFYIELEQFLISHNKTLFPCKSLLQWIDRNKNPRRGYQWSTRWLSSSHFIEYDDEATLTLLKLYFADVFGKNYKVVKR